MPVIYNETNPKAMMLKAEFERLFDASLVDPNLFVVVGGDGFMLRTLRRYYAPERVFLGLNCGRLGFLLNDIPDDVAKLVSHIMSSELEVMKFSRIRMSAECTDGTQFNEVAVNDIYLERMTGQTAHLRLQIDGQIVVKKLVSDGLIMCTALGSTAYNFSAGGSVCHPAMDVIGVTPICPHGPRLSPLVFPLTSIIEAEVLDGDRRRVRVSVDGFEYNDIARVRVCSAPHPVQLAFLPGHDFTATLVRKVLNT